MSLAQKNGWAKKKAKKKKAKANPKGKNNELELKDFFTSWTGFEFARNPQSGASLALKKLGLVADIICVDKTHQTPFAIETKFWASFAIHKSVTTSYKVIYKIWEEELLDDLTYCPHKIPLLAIRDNKSKGHWMILLDREIKGIKTDLLINNKEGITLLYGYWSYNWTTLVYKDLLEQLKSM